MKNHFFRRHRKSYIAYAKTAVIAVLFLIVAVPFAKKIAAGDTAVVLDYTRYLVTLNGEAIGCVAEAEDADAALLDARTQLVNQGSGLALVEADLEVTEVTCRDTIMSESQMAYAIYSILKEDVVDSSSTAVAYTVRIDDFTVTLASLDEVTELFEMVKEKYTDAENFSVELVQEDTGVYSVYRTNFVTADKEVNEAAKVLASENGTDTETEEEEVTYADGILSVDFVENIEIIETKEETADVISLEEAYELITNEHAEKGTYTVASGDCLSSIATKCGLTLAELYSMNEGLNDSSVIYAGDVLTITVPASEISMEIVEEQSYNESYNAEVQYVYNASIYSGITNVIQYGTAGERSVVALVTYVNGVEQSREILSQEVLYEATPTIIECGTKTPPSYLWPVYSTYITQYFGQNGGHSGLDIYVPLGTSVKAACSGTVVYSGWKGTLGYCVEIQNSDGVIVRYGHLSSLLCSYGQWVNQGQVVALSGSTGYSTGPHLHVTIIVNGSWVDPLKYLKY